MNGTHTIFAMRAMRSSSVTLKFETPMPAASHRSQYDSRAGRRRW
jgi:hypothetical protein